MSTPDLLKKLPLFHECTSAELTKLANMMQKVNIEAGEVIFKKGATGDALYLVREGTVEVLSPHSAGPEEANTPEDVVAVLGEGALFGEMALVEGEPRSATVRAKTDVKLWRIKKGYFDDIMSKDHVIAMKIYKRLTVLLSQRLRDTTERLAIANDIIKMTSRR
jgi:CRP/FNR family transcriptional regulator, cyclic AMP receptor protein